jgi:hypothetical protein
MRFSTKLHGYIDYGLAILLFVLPFLSFVGIGDVAGFSMHVAAMILVLSALLTDYELGPKKLMHMPMHLWIDGIVGLALALSPWLFVFYDTIWIPHVAIGVVLMAVAFLTHTVPGYDRRRRTS